MNKLIATILIILLVFTFAACKNSQEEKYSKAMELYLIGEYSLAISLFEELGDYKDSENIADEIVIKLNSTPTPELSIATPTPEPATPTPEPATPTPKPATPTPEPATPTPKPATPTPEPATPTPEPATPTPEPATPTPEPATPTLIPTPSPTPEPLVITATKDGSYYYVGSTNNTNGTLMRVGVTAVSIEQRYDEYSGDYYVTITTQIYIMSKTPSFWTPRSCDITANLVNNDGESIELLFFDIPGDAPKGVYVTVTEKAYSVSPGNYELKFKDFMAF